MENFWNIFLGAITVSEIIVNPTVDRIVEKTGVSKIKYASIVNVICTIVGIILSCWCTTPTLDFNFWRDCVLLVGGSAIVLKYGYDFVKELMEKARKA